MTEDEEAEEHELSVPNPHSAHDLHSPVALIGCLPIGVDNGLMIGLGM